MRLGLDCQTGMFELNLIWCNADFQIPLHVLFPHTDAKQSALPCAASADCETGCV